MPLLQVKVCGLTKPQDVRDSIEAGASYLGMIFVAGPRLLSISRALELIEAAAFRANGSPRLVAVVPTALETERLAPRCEHLRDFSLANLLSQLPVDVVQLHADPTLDDIRLARAAGAQEVWSVVRVPGGEANNSGSASDHSPMNFDSLRDIATHSDAIVFDASSLSGLGGTGHTFDWAQTALAIAPLRTHTRIVLAGGLTPDNVAAAVATFQPDIVDVSSGVELKGSPGVKDVNQVRRFIQLVCQDVR